MKKKLDGINVLYPTPTTIVGGVEYIDAVQLFFHIVFLLTILIRDL